MNRFTLTLLLFLISVSLHAQVARIDTLYYDKDWKAASAKEFACFYRLAYYPTDSLLPKMFRDFFITGELQGEGRFVSIDKYDDSKSLFDGEIVGYYRNGQKSHCYHYANCVENGKFTEYDENGLIKTELTMVNGQPHGLYTQFNKDGSYSQMEFQNGKPLYKYYIYVTKDGNSSKIDTQTNKIFWEDVTTNMRKTEYHNGTPWQYYTQNGLMVALTCTSTRDYGKWHRIDLIISNNSISSIELDPDIIFAKFINKKGQEIASRVWTHAEYMKKVNRAQTLAAVAVGLSEGMAAVNAGYSTSRTNTDSFYSGSANVFGSASAYGTNGRSSYGTYSGYGSYSGSSHSTKTTTTYDAAAAYQARVLSQQRIADFNNAQWQERKAKDEGYLKKTTIYPGETITGYVHIERKPGKEIYFYVPICGIEYVFGWNY